MCAQYLLPVNYLFKITHCSRKRANARNVSIENVIARRDRSRSGGGDILESRVYFYFFERTLVELFFVSYKILKKKKKKKKKIEEAKNRLFVGSKMSPPSHPM